LILTRINAIILRDRPLFEKGIICYVCL